MGILSSTMKQATLISIVILICLNFAASQYDYTYYPDYSSQQAAPPQPRPGFRRGGYRFFTNNPFSRPFSSSPGSGFLSQYTSGNHWATPYPGTLAIAKAQTPRLIRRRRK